MFFLSIISKNFLKVNMFLHASKKILFFFVYNILYTKFLPPAGQYKICAQRRFIDSCGWIQLSKFVLRVSVHSKQFFTLKMINWLTWALDLFEGLVKFLSCSRASKKFFIFLYFVYNILYFVWCITLRRPVKPRKGDLLIFCRAQRIFRLNFSF